MGLVGLFVLVLLYFPGVLQYVELTLWVSPPCGWLTWTVSSLGVGLGMLCLLILRGASFPALLCAWLEGHPIAAKLLLTSLLPF